MTRFARNDKTITDPVCGMVVGTNTEEISAEIEGKTYYFCAEICRNSFVKNPKKFICSEPPNKKSLWGRYVARLEKTSGGKAMKCH